MDPARLQHTDWISVPQSQLLTYIRLLDAARVWHREPRWIFACFHLNGANIGRCHAGPYTRFGKQRSDRFTISYHVVAIARRDFFTSFIDGLASSRMGGSRGL